MISDNGEVWDVKRNKESQIKSGKKQVEEYTKNIWKNNRKKELKVGGGRIKGDCFYYESGATTYKVTYFYAGSGVIAYDYDIFDVDYEEVERVVATAGVTIALSALASIFFPPAAVLAFA